MKRSFLSAAAIISFVQATSAMAAPEIAVDRPAYDFGTVSQGKKVEHLFVIRNKGDAPLTIKNVRPSCGCTAVATSASVIAPGKSGEIKASFDTQNYSGQVRKTVAVDSNDPKAPSTTLSLVGTITEEIQITPRQLNLGEVKVETAKKAAITITNKGNRPLRVTDVKSTMAQIAGVAEKKLLKPGESGTIMVSATPRKGDRLLSGYLTIRTDNPAKPEIMVPVYGSLAR